MQAFCNYHIKYKHTRWGGEYIKQYKLVVMKQLLPTSDPSAFFSRGDKYYQVFIHLPEKILCMH